MRLEALRYVEEIDRKALQINMVRITLTQTKDGKDKVLVDVARAADEDEILAAGGIEKYSKDEAIGELSRLYQVDRSKIEQAVMSAEFSCAIPTSWRLAAQIALGVALVALSAWGFAALGEGAEVGASKSDKSAPIDAEAALSSGLHWPDPVMVELFEIANRKRMKSGIPCACLYASKPDITGKGVEAKSPEAARKFLSTWTLEEIAEALREFSTPRREAGEIMKLLNERSKK